jgi:tripartite-type tricarboxylate transporter receptor subunit TctC
MKQAIRSLKWLLAAGALALSAAAPARAADYPDRPVKIVVGFAPGGANDILARLIAKELTVMWGQSVVVENKPGANGAIAFQQVAKAPADGYTLGLGTAGPTTMNQALQKLPFDVLKDFTPVVNLIDAPHALAVNAKLPVSNLQEFIAYARKAQPRLSYSSPGVGNSGHYAMEMLKQQAGVDITHVAYKGAAPALNDLIAGHVQGYFTSAAALLPHVNNGTIKVLAITGDKRIAQLPNVPTMAQAGFPDFEFPVYGGLLGAEDQRRRQQGAEVACIPGAAEAERHGAAGRQPPGLRRVPGHRPEALDQGGGGRQDEARMSCALRFARRPRSTTPRTRGVVLCRAVPQPTAAAGGGRQRPSPSESPGMARSAELLTRSQASREAWRA